ncbi:MAG TPA: hypothetical protein VGC16_01040 [Rhizomicrobium sp.]
MTDLGKWIGGILLGCAVLGAPAQAQSPRQDARAGNFDLWCQEHMKLPAERCDKRAPEDEKAYEAYRDKVDNYAEQQQLEKRRQDQIDKTILNNDPIDNPR